jgi:hypothetical protein
MLHLHALKLVNMELTEVEWPVNLRKVQFQRRNKYFRLNRPRISTVGIVIPSSQISCCIILFQS